MQDTDRIKVPRRQDRSSRVEKALAKTPRDGEWHRLLEMGFTSAEQTARGYNHQDAPWTYGYTHESKDGEMISVLWVKWGNDE